MKKHFTILCLSSSLVLLGMASTSKVSASNVNDIHNEVLPSTDLINGSQSTKNSSSQMRTELAGLSNYLNFNMIMNGSGGMTWDNRLSNSAMNPGQWKDWAVAKVNNDMVFTSGPSIAVNQSTFENKTSQTQVLSTPSFKETKSDTVTTTTTSSTGSSITTSAEMSFPFGGSSISMTVDYNYSTTNSVETSVTKEWEVPSQVVEVPAGKTYRIRWVFNQATARGTTDLNSHVTGIVNYKQGRNSAGTLYTSYYTTGNAITQYDKVPKTAVWPDRSKWDKSGNTAIRRWGTSRYVANYGTSLDTIIEDITNPSSPVHVKTITDVPATSKVIDRSVS